MHERHGHARNNTLTREYRAWMCAKARCYNPNVSAYRHYGGRGITMCEEWKESFSEFYSHMGPSSEGYSLDRIDNNKGYQPGNCRWVTMKEQARNKRNNTFIEFNGQTKTISAWAEELGACASKLACRLRAGHAVELVLDNRPEGIRKKTSKYKYVSWDKDKLKWRVVVTSSPPVYLGRFSNEEDAHDAVQKYLEAL